MNESPYPIKDTLDHIPNVYDAVLCVTQRARELKKENYKRDYISLALKEGGRGEIDRDTYLMKFVVEQLTKEKKDVKQRRYSK